MNSQTNKMIDLLETVYQFGRSRKVSHYVLKGKDKEDYLVSIGETQIIYFLGFPTLYIHSAFLELADFYCLKENPKELKKQFEHLLRKKGIKAEFLEKANDRKV